MNACSRCGLAHPASRPCPVVPALPANTTSVPLAVGTVVGGRFRIEQVAHRSGMSTVYQASDLRNRDTVVALKEFNAAGLPDQERAEALTWLAREAGLLSILNDPRLPKLLAAADEGDRHYVAMPFIHGETLEERLIREGPQAETVVLSWARELAGLLRYLHSQDPPVIHRDLKPANVLLRPDGSLALLDLGVARPLARGTPGTAVGTPGYAPPEQYQGLADERSDLYGLGATMHRALTGYNPDLEAPFRHPPVRDVRPDVSQETADLVAGLLQLAPAQRPEGAHALQAKLNVAMRGAFARAYRPVHLMYQQMLALFALAVALGAAIYVGSFGLPVVGGGAAAYKQSDPGGDFLRVLAVFAPGALTFLPLLNPQLRALARRHLAPRLHRNRAAKLLALTWGTPLLAWLLNLYEQHQGNLVAVPGHGIAAAGLALGSALTAMLGLLALQQDLRRLQVRVVRLHWRYVLIGGLCMLWPISLAMQWPVFMGSCYTAALQSEAQTQFSAIQALGADRHGDLYILDQYGLRERTPDDMFHLLLDFNEPNGSASPLYSQISYTQMSVSPDGQVVLGRVKDPTVYLLLRPGRVVRAVTSPYADYSGMALADGGILYLSNTEHGKIYAFDLNQQGRYRVLEPTPMPKRWQPATLAVDYQGTLYATDAGTNTVAQISPSGHVRVVATATAGKIRSVPPVVIIQAPNSFTLTNDIYASIHNGQALLLLQIDASPASGLNGLAAQIGDTFYEVTSEGPLAASLTDGSAVTIGGNDAATQHCEMTR